MYEYSFLVAEIRKNLARGLPLNAATKAAVETCMPKGILESFLRRHRAEVKQMILEEYDAEFHIRCEKELGFQEGHKVGERKGTALANRLCSLLLKEKRYADLERAAEDSKFQSQLFKEYHLQ
ncbi:MAG: hypothetical protein HFE83_03175 [Lachnospiraceae bacterium]|nr:hypothetical protein [Lachnospiraceae bacterium]